MFRGTGACAGIAVGEVVILEDSGLHGGGGPVTERPETDYPEGSVLVAHDVTPEVVAALKSGRLIGLVTEMGGKDSHLAILARTMEVAAVFGVVGFMDFVSDGDMVIVDGDEGIIYVNPRENTMKKYEKKRRQEQERQERLEKLIGCEAVTRDGRKVALMGNADRVMDIRRVIRNDGEGVGLFRSEHLFFDRCSLPNEDEQFEVYRKAVTSLEAGMPLVIRTLDVGGDKEIAYLGMHREKNPFLGYRGIRFSLGRADIFHTQLKAILRASAYGKIRILLPMVTSVEEFRRARAVLELMKEQLMAAHIPYDDKIELGVMIETPSAAVLADVFAREADFISIGTNDLIQYVVAVDRGNRNVSYLYSAFHPAVLRCIRYVIRCCKQENTTAAMCGEAAGELALVPLFLAFGLEEFSVRPAEILPVKHLITRCSGEQLEALEQQVMRMETAEEIESYLGDFVKELLTFRVPTT